VEKRVKDLLGRMTIEDKMSQLIQGVWPIHLRCFIWWIPNLSTTLRASIC
jgi:hypothetical protein